MIRAPPGFRTPSTEIYFLVLTVPTPVTIMIRNKIYSMIFSGISIFTDNEAALDLLAAFANKPVDEDDGKPTSEYE